MNAKQCWKLAWAEARVMRNYGYDEWTLMRAEAIHGRMFWLAWLILR